MARREQTLVGYILSEKKDSGVANDDSESDEDSEEQLEFLDMKEMDSVSSGCCVFQSSLPPATDVKFMVSRNTFLVHGRFALRDPWWEITCSVRRIGRKFLVKGYPSYSLRTPLQEENRANVSLFLKQCGVDPYFVFMFFEWLPQDRHVDLTNVEEALNDFGRQSEKEKAAVDYALRHFCNSDARCYVRAASKYPQIMKYMPTLLPGQFLKLLNGGKGKDRLTTLAASQNTDASAENLENTCTLATLEELIKTTVWKLGFGYIMWKEFKLVRCEAKLGAFKDCKLFWNIPPLQQNALLVYDDLKVYCRRQGHTYIEREHLQNRMRKQKIPEESAWEAVDFLRKQGVLQVERQKIALRNLFKYETGIADCLYNVATGEPWLINVDVKEVLRSYHRERMRARAEADAAAQRGEEHDAVVSHEPAAFLDSSPNSNSSIEEEPDPMPIELDPDQVRAAKMMCDNPVTVISGKGGCGKTTVVSLVFKAAVKQQENKNCCSDKSEENEKEAPLEVLLTAPTGRAASLLTKKTSFKAYTMHQVVWSFMNSAKSPSGEPKNWKFAHVQVLVVDEGSLVSVQILHSLLTMLTKYANLQKFILLGDIRQLPSIEPGNLLNDLFQSYQRVNWAIEMRTNHRTESELIVQNAGLIAEMGLKKTFSSLKFDAVLDLNKPFTVLSPDKKFIHIVLPEDGRDDDVQMSIKKLLSGPAPGLKHDRFSQFVAFTRKDCALINELCCQHYSRHPTRNHKKKMDFQIGDKVCCTKNGYVTDKDKEKEFVRSHMKEDIDGTQKKVPKDRLCNGEIFFIAEDLTEVEVDKRKRRSLTLCNESGEVVLTADYRELQRECKLRHAWARTIHTFQGSEEKTIVYVLGDSLWQNWKHVYTAVTRGQQRVYVIAKESGLSKAIPGQVINRNTRLAGLVTDHLGTLRSERKDLFTQPDQSVLGTPQRGSSFSSFHSPKQSLSQISPVRICAKASFNSPGQNQYKADEEFGEQSISQSGGSSMCKRRSSTDIYDTPTKQPKNDAMESPLGCTRLDLLSLDGQKPKPLVRNLFTGADQSLSK